MHDDPMVVSFKSRFWGWVSIINLQMRHENSKTWKTQNKYFAHRRKRCQEIWRHLFNQRIIYMMGMWYAPTPKPCRYHRVRQKISPISSSQIFVENRSEFIQEVEIEERSCWCQNWSGWIKAATMRVWIILQNHLPFTRPAYDTTIKTLTWTTCITNHSVWKSREKSHLINVTSLRAKRAQKRRKIRIPSQLGNMVKMRLFLVIFKPLCILWL